MSLAQGRQILAIPGPSVMPDRVLNAMHRAAPNIYAGALVDMMPGLRADLQAVARTAQNVAIYIANGHGAWEAANVNMFRRGDKALSLVTGRFGEGWAQQARDLGVEVEMIDFGRSAPVDANRVEAALRADTQGRIRTVLLTHVDTASSVLNDVAAVRAALDAVGHPALLAVDCIASMGCDRFEFDAWGVDVAVSASQKGLMVPPGLGFVWVSDRALELCRESDLRTPYWDWTVRARATEFWMNFGGTAPTHHLYGLREALTMIVHEEGLEHVWARHDTLARAVWAAFEAWGDGASNIALNIADPAARARAVTGARIAAPDATRLRQWCETEAGVTLGIGLGMAPPDDPRWHGYLRVGHMGHVNAHMVLGTLAVMEAGLQALGIAHGSGGVAAAARVVAGG
ncbi:alanine-glyoxylate transaminase / serine-glyoxylate transaminase / serine-pyruvate transaminase [Gemmobacter megaterium]|uniref:Alanine-glyoxylate transaminase / serine-glyoxylate transaminase / serine-pyruvate transaminase n=1 Tax=Gemmobacter megaterium TaxID=1086013 RepID=A0A1N7QMS4_9RHOB|nr:aminotransferase class V-fold PLP-dependent enzyme [Gemmobacter megaterium]GGE27782.1 septum site-determining protein [Gemmobacter megaterium]SIT24205.1 alanine-glyoxylate transaminase / serine-glyoxylate transaminase / serine-pyruvate transaminase [Gemmobacter megaterium]